MNPFRNTKMARPHWGFTLVGVYALLWILSGWVHVLAAVWRKAMGN